MKKTLLRIIVTLTVWAPVLAQDKDLDPGLVAEYFALNTGPNTFPNLPATVKPTYVRVEKNVDYGDVTGDFYGTRLTDNFYARWTGVLRVEKAGKIQFWTESDDGSRLVIDGKVVVDNGGVHPMTEKAGAAELTAGDHEVKIEFYQGGGEAGCKVSWQPPGGGRQAIPAKAFFHKKGAEQIAWDEAAWKKRAQGKAQAGPGKRGSGKFAEMDHGPFAAGTIDALWGGKNNWANKGIAIKLDDEKKAHVCFDPEQMRMASGWTGGIGWPAGRDGLEGQPFADGNVLWGTKKASLGFPKGGDWKDPRGKVPFGPLPRDWAHWNGHYRHGELTVLSYTVGDAEILELPGFDAKSDIFSRTFNISRASGPIPMLVVEKDGATSSMDGGAALLESGETVIAVAGAGATVEANTGRIEAKLSPGKSELFVWAGPKGDLPKFHAAVKSAAAPADLAPLTKGGPGRNTAVTTAGVLGKETGPFQVDVLTVPYDNPSKSYMRLTGVDFFADGKRAAVCTMDGDVWIVSGIDDTLEKLTWKRFASGLFQTLGLRIVDDAVYTLGRDQITRFHDFNNDGEADYYENFNNDCGVTPAYHEFAHDLHTDSQGNFYYLKGSNLGTTVVPYHGCLIKVEKYGKSSEVWTTGFRAPNGMSVGPGDVLTTSDNQGNWVPSTPINYITQKGQFCGFLPCSHQTPAPKDRPDPLCWIPYNQDNSGGGQLWATTTKWGAFNGELFHLSYGKCVLFHVLREKVGDVWQGGVTKFPFKFISGSMRGRFNAVDGQMYFVGMRGWQTDGTRDGCFERIRFTGKAINMPLTAKVSAGAIAITFTDKLDGETAGAADSYSAEGCNIRWTGDYGSPEFWITQPAKKGREPLPVQSASLLPDGKTVSLKIEGLKPMHHLVIRYKIKGADGAAISQELDYTINKIP
jgi:glucose/arabinose dehydrogenase